MFFLHEELTKLPAFPRKALETDFHLYKGGHLGNVRTHITLPLSPISAEYDKLVYCFMIQYLARLWVWLLASIAKERTCADIIDKIVQHQLLRMCFCHFHYLKKFD